MQKSLIILKGMNPHDRRFAFPAVANAKFTVLVNPGTKAIVTLAGGELGVSTRKGAFFHSSIYVLCPASSWFGAMPNTASVSCVIPPFAFICERFTAALNNSINQGL